MKSSACTITTCAQVVSPKGDGRGNPQSGCFDEISKGPSNTKNVITLEPKLLLQTFPLFLKSWMYCVAYSNYVPN